MIRLPHTCSANKLPEVVWYCWRWAQSNIFPGLSVGPTSVFQTCSFCIILLFKDIIFIPVLVLINECHVVWCWHRDFSQRDVRFISVAKKGSLLSEKLQKPLLTVGIKDCFLQIKCYLTSFYIVFILINVFIICILNKDKRLVVNQDAVLNGPLSLQ